MQIQELADAGGIPVKFLEQILLTLKRSGLLRSKRGVGGGYQLDRPARAVTVGEIIELIDGDLCSLAAGDETADAPSFPGSRGLEACFHEIDQLVNERLGRRTIEEILAHESPDAMMAFGI